MAQVELVMPKMGESIMEATILKWVKKVGDTVQAEETILEIATDKVDSEVPSPASGVITQILFEENAVVPIGTVIAVIGTEVGADTAAPAPASSAPAPVANGASAATAPVFSEQNGSSKAELPVKSGDRFYSPLVRTIAREENISVAELDAISGSGREGRVTKKDVIAYLDQRQSPAAAAISTTPPAKPATASTVPAVSVSGNVEIIEMDRMRKLIADHMVMSKQTSPHVTSFVEVDVTHMVQWREQNKGIFEKKYGEKITFTPFFIEAVVKAIGDYPMINASVDGSRIIRKKDINIGMAAALPSGNLIVPVIKGADQLNLVGITRSVNDLAARARANKLKPEEIQDGTFTLTNVGTFGNVMGTPIINQPQVAIMATGAIRKKPAVVETPYGDLIAVRHMMFLSLSYDHRVVDGFLGGSFLRKVADYLEAFDPNRSV
jgi:2-oxoglutarate dehydrogenase E2 component (dihydrolipoamide succinyltransferase)